MQTPKFDLVAFCPPCGVELERRIALGRERPDLPAGCSVADVLQAADDASDARFFGIDELPDRIAFENSQTVLRLLRSEFRDGDLS